MSEATAVKPLNEDRDPARWAREFIERNEGTIVGGPTVDEGTLIAWFASAMMCGEDTYRWRKEAEERSAVPSQAGTAMRSDSCPAPLDALWAAFVAEVKARADLPNDDKMVNFLGSVDSHKECFDKASAQVSQQRQTEWEGIAQDLEKLRSALDYIAILPDSYPSSAIIARARDALKNAAPRGATAYGTGSKETPRVELPAESALPSVGCVVGALGVEQVTPFDKLPGPVQEAIGALAKYYAEHHKLGMSIKDDMTYIACVALRWKHPLAHYDSTCPCGKYAITPITGIDKIQSVTRAFDSIGGGTGKATPWVQVFFPVDDWQARDAFASALGAATKRNSERK